MSTAVIAFFQAYPPTSGSGQAAYNVAKYSSGPKYLLQSADSHSKQSSVDEIVVHNLGRLSENKIRRTIQVCRQSRNVVRILSEIKPDVIILEGATALYCLIALHAIRMRGPKSKIVYHAHGVDYQVREGRGHRFYARIAKWAERRVLKKADLVCAVSSVDAAHFRDIYGVETVVLPSGVDIERFAAVTPEQIRGLKDKYALRGKTVLFMGLVSHPPNKDGIAFLVNKVFPSVVNECPEAKLVIFGGKVDYTKEWLINPGRIPFEEVPIFVKACDVCVAPIFYGSGTRLKILEYFGAGKPVVATAKGAEGIDVKHNETIILAETPQEHISGILSLLRNPDLAGRLGANALNLVKSQYDWKTIMEGFEKILSSYE